VFVDEPCSKSLLGDGLLLNHSVLEAIPHDDSLQVDVVLVLVLIYVLGQVGDLLACLGLASQPEWVGLLLRVLGQEAYNCEGELFSHFQFILHLIALACLAETTSNWVVEDDYVSEAGPALLVESHFGAILHILNADVL